MTTENYDRVYNFSPGPAVLPLPVLERVRDNLINYAGTGLGIMELSHRSAAFEEIIVSAEELIRQLLGVPEAYEIIFATGGGTQQFSMVPMNLLTPGLTGDYVVTGEWAKRALEEAQKFGATASAASSEDKNFSYIPAAIQVSANSAYVHFTSNNTIFGTQAHREPDLGDRAGAIPLVCDASSDLFYKPLHIEKYGLIYAAAQKNFGPAGVTAVIIRKDLLERSQPSLPVLMNYNTYVGKHSLYNTPPTFVIYVIREVLNWMAEQGGLAELYTQNQAKAALIYDAIDESDFYVGHAERESRSMMNITFRLKNQDLEKSFVKQAEAYGLSGLAGYRAVGGIRASVYNAFPIAGCRALAEFMRSFAKTHG